MVVNRTGEKVGAVPSNIAGRIRNMIAVGQLGPGMRLGQNELAEMFEASRVPVREALKLLTAEGVVEHDPNRGFFVERFSSAEALQFFRLREMLEEELLPTIAWPDKEGIRKFKELAAQLEELLDQGRRVDWWSEHQAFHQRIFDLSPNKIFVREAMRYWGLTDRYRALVPLPRRDSTDRQIVNKADLVEALERRNIASLLEVRRRRRKAFENVVLEILADRGL